MIKNHLYTKTENLNNYLRIKEKKQFKQSLPHLIPKIVGQAPWRDLKSFSPFLFKLYQKANEPFRGKVACPKIGNPVAPPSTSESYKNDQQI